MGAPGKGAPDDLREPFALRTGGALPPLLRRSGDAPLDPDIVSGFMARRTSRKDRR